MVKCDIICTLPGIQPGVDIAKEVSTLLVPRNRWTPGSWNNKLPQFLPLAEMVGCYSPNPSLDELQVVFDAVGSAKVFAESVEKFVERTGKKPENVRRQLLYINHKLGLMDPLPLRSLMEPRVNPMEFDGVAFLVPGTISWTGRRLERIKMIQEAGARFERIIVFHSSRVCDSTADWRHPYIRDVATKGREPTEKEVLKQWLYGNRQYVFAELPDVNERGKNLSLQEQLQHFVATGQFDQYVAGQKIFVATNPNALYVPLHIKRVLELDDIWFSQGAAGLVTPVPDHWWPEDQDLMTTPSGIIRLWTELKRGGFITDDAHLRGQRGGRRTS